MIYLTQRLDHAHPVTASVTLPIDVRVKSRARVALNDGREAGLMLPRGLLLRGGDLLTTDDGSEVIEVIAAPESVSVVRCADPFLLARACYHRATATYRCKSCPANCATTTITFSTTCYVSSGWRWPSPACPLNRKRALTPAMPTAMVTPTLIHIKDSSCVSIYRCFCWPFPFRRLPIPVTGPTAFRQVFSIR